MDRKAQVKQTYAEAKVKQRQGKKHMETTVVDIVKVDMTIAPGLQVGDPSKRPKRRTLNTGCLHG